MPWTCSWPSSFITVPLRNTATREHQTYTPAQSFSPSGNYQAPGLKVKVYRVLKWVRTDLNQYCDNPDLAMSSERKGNSAHTQRFMQAYTTRPLGHHTHSRVLGDTAQRYINCTAGCQEQEGELSQI